MKQLLFLLIVLIFCQQSMAQNVGIGTATPADKLSVVNALPGYGVTHTYGPVVMGTYISDLNGQFGTKTNHPLQFFTNNGNAQMTLLQNGNVGIGTNLPAYKLDILHDGDNSIRIKSTSGYSAVDVDGVGDGALRLFKNGSAKWNMRNFGVNNNLEFYEFDGGDSRMLFERGTGRVGFKTRVPQTDLHINPSGAGSILIGTDKNSGGYTDLEMGISAQSGGYSYVQSTESSGSTYGNLYLNPNGGNVGINTTVATHPLDIVQIGEGFGKALRIRTAWSGTNYNWAMYGFASLYFSLNGVDKGFIDYIDGSWNSTSDLRYKKDINKMDNVLDKVMSLNAKTYHYNDQKENDRLCTGFVAQEVLPFFPEFVNSAPSQDSNDHSPMYGINYGGFSVIAIKAIQEQQTEIDLLKEQNKMILEELSKLKAAKN